MQLTQEQEKKLKRIAKLVDFETKGAVVLIEDIFALEDEFGAKIPELTELVEELRKERPDRDEIKEIVNEIVGTVIPEKGDKGDDYILTEDDKREIASMIEVPKPQPDRIIEKHTETIREQPIEIIKEVAVIDKTDLTKEGEAIRDGLELLQDDERLDKKAIKGLDDYDEVARLAKQPRHIGGGKQNLYQQNDVNIQSPTNGQVLKYNSTNNLWENGTDSGGLQPGDNVSELVNDAGYITASDLPTSLLIYPTTAASSIGGYYRLVTSMSDPVYDKPAVDVATGAISGSNQLISSLASDAGIVVGDLGIFNVTIVGNIRKTAGATSTDATFYFEVYKRESSGTETLIATSDSTRVVSSTTYEEFFATALFNDGTFLTTDRLVLKFYGTKVGGGIAPQYDFQFGGVLPVRVSFPVPTQNLLSYYIPYTGAAKNVDLGDNWLMADRGIGINNATPVPYGSTGYYALSLSNYFHIVGSQRRGYNGDSYILDFVGAFPDYTGTIPTTDQGILFKYERQIGFPSLTRLTYNSNYITYYTGVNYVFTLTENNAEFQVPVTFNSSDNFFTFFPSVQYDETTGFINTRSIITGFSQDNVINQVGTGATINSMSPDPAYWEQTYMIKLFDRGNFIKPIYVAGYTAKSSSSGTS